MKNFVVQNGEHVVQGQVIGKEGTTGNSDGDHIHWGLHSGDPKVKVESSTSVLAKFIIAKDLTGDSDFKQMGSDEFIGGLSNGHFYESDNYAAVLQFSGSSTVYLSSNGKLWPILNEQTYSLLGYGNCNCSSTPNWSYVTNLPSSEKSKYSIRREVVPSENDFFNGKMIAYRVVPKVGPVSCMCVDVDPRRIYLFEGGKFCHIANGDVYKALGYKMDFSDVVIITPDWRRRRFI